MLIRWSVSLYLASWFICLTRKGRRYYYDNVDRHLHEVEVVYREFVSSFVECSDEFESRGEILVLVSCPVRQFEDSAHYLLNREHPFWVRLRRWWRGEGVPGRAADRAAADVHYSLWW